MSLESLLARRDISSEVQEVIKKELSEFRKTKSRLEYLLKSGPAIIYACEPWDDYRTIFMSENVKDILGHDPEKFLYNHSFWVDGIHPEDRERVTETFSLIFERNFFSDVYRFQQKDGTYRWMLEEANLIRDEKGNPLEIVGHWTDVTLQKKAEEQLRNERENLYRILNSTDDAIYIIDSQHEIQFINAATEKEFGLVEGKKCYDYFNQFTEACPWCTTEKVVKGETIRRERTMARNQKTYDMIATPFRNLDGSVSSLATLRDISDRKKAEEALCESEEKYRSFVENFQGIAFKGYEDFSTGFFLGNVEKITGYAEDDFISGEIVYNQLIHPEDIQWVDDEVEEFMSSSQSTTQREYRIIDKNGNIHWIQESIQKFYDETQKKGGVHGTLQEFTERKRAEEALRESQELFTQFMDHLPAAVFIKDDESKTLFANKYLKDVFGGENWIGKTTNELFSEETALKMIADDQKALNEGLQIITEELMDNRNVVNTYRTYKFPIKRENKENLLGGIAIDITERMQAEEAMRRSEERLRAFMDAATDAIELWDSSLNLVECNQAVIDEFPEATKKEDLIGKNIIDLIPDIKETGRYHQYLEVIRTGNPLFLESFTSHPKFGNKYYSVKAFKVGEGLGMVNRDVTDEKQAEKALRESEAKYRNLVERAYDGIAIIQDSKISFLNRQVAEILGYTVEEMLNTSFINYIHPDYHSVAIKRYQARMAGQDVPSRYELKLIRKDGQVLEAEINAGVIKYQNSPADFAIVRDITERKRAEEQLQYQANLLTYVSDAVIASDLDFRITSWNKTAEGMYGWQEEEVLGKEVGQLLGQEYPYDRREDVVKDFMREGVWQGEVIQISKDGTAINILASVSLVKDRTGKPIAALAVNRDITKRKKIEEALKKSEEKYRHLFESAPIGIGMADLKGNILDSNQRMLNATGYSLEEIKTISLGDTYVNTKDRKKLLEALQESGYIRDFEVQLKRKDGTPYYSLLDVVLMELGGQQVLLTTLRDLTEWREMDRARRESEERLLKFMESATDGFTLLDSNLNFIDMNKSGLKGLGLTKEQIMGKNILDIFPDAKESGMYEKCLEVIRTGKPSYIDVPGVRQKDYSVRIFKVGESLGAISTDITDQMKAEKTREELEQRRDNFVWMTSHELRTPLTVLTGYCDFLIKHIKDLAQKRITNILSVMKSNLDRLELLASEVSTIGQIERGVFEIEKTSMDLCDFLQDTIEPYHQLLENQFEFQGCLDNASVIIDGDAHRLQQVLDNIIGNAIKQTDRDHRKIMVTLKRLPTDIKIEVSDNGAGIESENLEVIFEQFVSIPTEFSATGTGIGLYLCRKTLEEHGGRITAKSKGQGQGQLLL